MNMQTVIPDDLPLDVPSVCEAAVRKAVQIMVAFQRFPGAFMAGLDEDNGVFCDFEAIEHRLGQLGFDLTEIQAAYDRANWLLNHVHRAMPSACGHVGRDGVHVHPHAFLMAAVVPCSPTDGFGVEYLREGVESADRAMRRFLQVQQCGRRA